MRSSSYHWNRSHSNSSKYREDMRIQKRVVDLSMGRSGIFTEEDLNITITNSTAKSRKLKTSSRIHEISIFPQQSSDLKENRSSSFILVNSAKRSRSKGISLVSPESKKSYKAKKNFEGSNPKITLMQKKSTMKK